MPRSSSCKNTTYLSICLVVVAVACTLANGALVLFDGHPPYLGTRSLPRSMTKLPRPNQFIGLDRIERQTPPISREFVNYPFLLTQIDSSRPAYVYADNPKGHMTFRGYISPEDRRVHVSSA
ncbi:hypothetical protein NEOLEDRAFT_1098772, partial [Neolentinus lepideus HHB14362 ss-1]